MHSKMRKDGGSVRFCYTGQAIIFAVIFAHATNSSSRLRVDFRMRDFSNIENSETHKFRQSRVHGTRKDAAQEMTEKGPRMYSSFSIGSWSFGTC